ncbi:DUF177 domain-containing protein [Coprothermobacteraceae bacterium]|nr:DUF177 domain-containing protein [Coprothermobacteraceae bacterium]
MEVEQREFAEFGVLVDAVLEVEVPCDRCGELYWQTVELDFEEVFILGREPEPQAGEKQLTGEDVMTFYFPNGRVDVVELLSEYILSSLPERLLCRPDCPGPKAVLDELGYVDLILNEGGAD